VTSAVGLLEQAHVGVKVWLEYVYLKYPPGTFYVIDKLNVLEHMSGLDFCFRAFSLSVFATMPADIFLVYNFRRPYSQYLHIRVSDLVC